MALQRCVAAPLGIRWVGGAFFTTDGRQIVELWVLGDVDSVKQQLNARLGFSPG
jgi:hypothetical protein